MAEHYKDFALSQNILHIITIKIGIQKQIIHQIIPKTLYFLCIFTIWKIECEKTEYKFKKYKNVEKSRLAAVLMWRYNNTYHKDAPDSQMDDVI